jgi:hypothetical protein
VPRYEVKRAPAVTLQFLWESQTGAKQMTRARLLWDAQALYVGFDADDADITARFEQRDDPTYRDARSRSSSTRTRSRRSCTTGSR